MGCVGKKRVIPLLLSFLMLNNIYGTDMIERISVRAHCAVQRAGVESVLTGCALAKRGPSHYRLCRDQWRGNARTLHSAQCTFHSMFTLHAHYMHSALCVDTKTLCELCNAHCSFLCPLFKGCTLCIL